MESRLNVLAQHATHAALPCLLLAQEEGELSIQTCGDDEEAIAAAISAVPKATFFIEQTAFTRSLVEKLEFLDGSQLKIIVRADDLTPSKLEECVHLGCAGVITSDLSLQALHRMLLAVEAGEMWLERKWSSYVIRQLLIRQRGPKISRREYDVLNLLRRKLKNREIASALAISEETLRWHLRHLYAKTKRRSRVELVNYAEALNSDEFRVRMQFWR